MTRKTDSGRRVAIECTPRRVAAAVDALYEESLNTPELGENAGWVELARWWARRAEWYERLRVQWSRLGDWALATGQPHAVWRATLEAEWRAATNALDARARATRHERDAVRFGALNTSAVA